MKINCDKKLSITVVCSVALAVFSGCGGGPKEKAQNQDFFTSGSRDADQRAEQRMAQSEQLNPSSDSSGKETKAVVAAKSSSPGDPAGATNQAAQAKGKMALFDRLGGEEGLTKIVSDFLQRAMQDPRVNWDRQNVTRGGFSLHAGKSETWTNSPPHVALLQKHFVEFLSLATGGPAHYAGKEITTSHAHMHITNAEFDATIGDLKVTLDRLQVPNTEQKELLAIIESTRPQIVTER